MELRRLLRYLAASTVVAIAFWLRVHELSHAPPGLSFDEMVNGVDALRVAQGYYFPLFDDPNRPEPLYRLVAGVMLALGGYTTFTLRLSSAFLGTLTVAAAYRTSLEAIRASRSQRSRFEYSAALFAASILALTISHVTLSRVAYRAIPLPLFSLLFAFSLFRAVETGSERHFTLAGLWLGLAWESYTAGPALTAMMVLYLAHQLVFAPGRLSRQRRGVPMMAAAFIAIASPLIYRMLMAPHATLGHAHEVAGDLTVQNLLIRYRRAWDTLAVRGDVNPQYNVWSSPLIPDYYPLFLIGLAVCLMRIGKLAGAWCLAWPVVALAPVALANEVPHGLRVIMIFAAFPPVLALGADGLLSTLWWLLKRLWEDIFIRIPGEIFSQPHRSPTYRLQAAVNTVLCIAALLPLARAPGVESRYLAYWDADFTWHVYGRDIRHSDWFFRTAQVEIAQFIRALGEPVYIPIDELDWQTTRFHLTRDFPNVKAFDNDELPPGYVVIPFDLARDGLMDDVTQYVLLNPSDGSMTLLPPVTDGGLERIRRKLRGEGESFYRSDGSELLGEFFRVNEPHLIFDLAYPPPHEAFADFGGDMAVLGWDGPEDLEPARDLTFTLYWQALRDMCRDRFVFAQLWDFQNRRWGGDDVQVWRWLYPTGMWQPGDMVPDRHTFAMPEDAPWGVYYLVVGVYDVTGERLPVLDDDGAPAGDYAVLAALRIPQPEPPNPEEAPHEFDGLLGDSIALVGFDLDPDETGSISVRLYWQALKQVDESYTIFLHLQDSSGSLVAQSDSLPYGGRYPTTVWAPGEVVATSHTLTIPDSAAPPFTLYAGMYPWPSMERLMTTQEGRLRPDGRLELISFGRR